MKPRATALVLLSAATILACTSTTKVVPAPSPGVEDTAADGGAPDGPLSLEVGEAAEIAVRGDTAFARLATSGGEKLVVVLASTRLDGSPAPIAYAAAVGEEGEDTGAKKLDGCSLPRWTDPPPADEGAPTGSGPNVGDTRTLRVLVGQTSKPITARAAAVGSRAVVWVDTTPEHPATLDKAFIDEFLADFESTILPRARAIFGTESDRDGDGRIGLVFSPLTKDSAVAFFSGCDLAALQGCPEGNQGEYLYLTPPADIAPPYNTPAAIKETLAHELGHLVHFNRKVLRNKLSSWLDGTYMIEGFGAFTQDVVGFQSGNLYVAKAGLDGIDGFSLADVFTPAPTDRERDGLLRGGAYWVVRFLYDRGGADTMKTDGTLENRGGPSFVRALLDGASSVADGVKARAGGSLSDVGADFYTALALSGKAKNPCFSFAPTTTDPLTKKQRGGDPLAAFHGQAMKGPAMRALSSADKKLRPGGVEYLTVAVPAEQTELALRVTVPGSAQPRVRVVRVQ